MPTKYKIFLGKGRCPLTTPARTHRLSFHWPQNMDGGQHRKIEAKRPPYWSSQKAVVTALLSMKVLWDIQEDDPNNAFLIKKTYDKEQM